MSDNEIRKILIERKKQERKIEKRTELIGIAGDLIGWASLFGVCFMLAAIGG